MIGAAMVSLITSLAGEFVGDWKQKRANKREIDRAVTENKIRLAQSAESHNQNWEMAILTGQDRFLRRVSFALLSFPIVWAYFDPAGAADYFELALGALPDWYIQAYLGVLAAVWGLSELRRLK